PTGKVYVRLESVRAPSLPGCRTEQLAPDQATGLSCHRVIDLRIFPPARACKCQEVDAMTARFRSCLVLGGTIGVLATSGVHAQVKSPASEYPISAAFDPAYKAPRTPDGQPDLQGVYNSYNLVPDSRPKELGKQEF